MPAGPRDADGDAVECRQCEAAAEFWLYDRTDGAWRPLCERHVVRRHPSIELHAWLESGYAKPIELDRPAGPPSPPRHGRGVAFRALVEDVLE